jgi:Protein of unknown function, DUF547
MKICQFLLCISFAALGQSKLPPNDIYDRLLKKHVSADGKVDYQGFVRDTLELNKYLRLLSTHPPIESTWSESEQMAYWINAYNAFTIKLITRYYPIKSIKDIGSSIQIPFVNTPWDIKFILIGKEKMDLNHIEHGQLRKKFDDPRIHMALVCASKSCPILLNEPYDPIRLDAQLTQQTKAFLADTYRNQLVPDHPRISMIFNWYSGDFNKKGGSVRSFINTHSQVKIKDNARISYLDYDWSLNGR